ncbi:hypothetical protein CMV_000339 [Castanea mollissima]|uniref:Uncharacterized protein n=1 Tax=Castanea mollissima TaxID=60419 RepID=A0A8J4RZD8_9ROSI|nr:hypothetical protein CMV_000339 [Castanea mollissima]
MSKSGQPPDLKKKLVEPMRFLWEAWQVLNLIILIIAAVLSLALGIKTEVREYDSRRSYSRSGSRDSRQSYSRSPYMSRSPTYVQRENIHVHLHQSLVQGLALITMTDGQHFLQASKELSD